MVDPRLLHLQSLYSSGVYRLLLVKFETRLSKRLSDLGWPVKLWRCIFYLLFSKVLLT